MTLQNMSGLCQSTEVGKRYLKGCLEPVDLRSREAKQQSPTDCILGLCMQKDMEDAKLCAALPDFERSAQVHEV